MTDPVLIGVDWGTTNARAYTIGAEGAIIARGAEAAGAAHGIMHVANGAFPETLARLVGTLQAPPSLPITLSGMITSRQGWVETAYVECPARFADVAAAAQRRDGNGRALLFAPGLSCREADGAHDVMRGEELQILGAFATDTSNASVFCLPGTHSKWAWVADGAIERFRTVMTGEVFAALCDHTILGRLMAGREHRADAFTRGADRARAGGYVLHDIFAVRTEGLFARIEGDALASYLSGLLIGHEVAAMAGALEAGTVVGVIGGAALAERYRTVLEGAGHQVRLYDAGDVVARGQLGLARATGLVR